MTRALRICTLASLLLHLVALFMADSLWYEERAYAPFRARLLLPARFVEAARQQVPRPDLPRVEMERLPAEEGLAEVPEGGAAPYEVPVLPAQGSPAGPLSPREPVGAKAANPELAREHMPDPQGPLQVDPAESEAMELLRLEDLARADGARAVVIADPSSRRHTRGFVKFTPLRLDGAGSYAMDPEVPILGGGRPVLEDLARFVRDHTQVSAQVRGNAPWGFFTRALLEDPVHFLFPAHGRGTAGSGERVRLTEEERALLGEYLRGGGFLFADAGGSADDRRFLRSLVAELRQVLGAEGRLFEIPAEHAIYHAFYTYARGFPGEEKGRRLAGEGWHYPDRAPCGDPPRGLWGVALGDELVGAISDLELHRAWSGIPSTCAEEEAEEPVEESEVEPPVQTPFLQAATNVVFYALLRPQGKAVKRAPPAWEKVRPLALPGLAQSGERGGGLADELEAALAVIRVGEREGGGGLRVRVDGAFSAEVAGGDGVLLRNLQAGTHRVEVEYGGERREVEVVLGGGQVLTVGCRLRRLGLFAVLRLEPFAERVSVATWGERFADLQIGEVFVRGAEDWPPP